MSGKKLFMFMSQIIPTQLSVIACVDLVAISGGGNCPVVGLRSPLFLFLFLKKRKKKKRKGEH